jgi:hypothetical protein
MPIYDDSAVCTIGTAWLCEHRGKRRVYPLQAFFGRNYNGTL